MPKKSDDTADAPAQPDTSGMRKGLTSYGDQGFSLFLRKAFIKGAGYTDAALDRPVIGIADTSSAYNPCHGNAPQLVEAVKRGVMLAGGLPMPFPTISIHESFAAPTSMFLRNLMSIDTEEMIRAQPMDAVVLIGGCDKTVPAQLMGAASANIPAIQLVTGSMLTGSHRGERVGACTDCRRYWGRFRAGEIDAEETADVNDQLIASVGTCSVMGTASTMACIAEALGMTVPGGASPPAVTADRIRVAEQTGAQAVQMARDKLTTDKILTPAAFENAMRVLLAIGGSTNGIVHLAAIAGRVGLEIDLQALDRMGRETPVLLDLKPSGQHYMEDFHKAGGMATLLRELKPLLRLDAMTVTGRTLGEEIERAGPGFAQNVVRSVRDPIYPQGGIAVLQGNLAPGGAIIKQSAADEKLMEHEGRAVVFENAEDVAARIDSDDLDVTSHDILVLKNIGPKGAPGMPEAGYIPIPRKLARAGVKDIVRISDGRMSGTAFGTIVLHVTPESAIGGPLAHVRNGDRIRLSVKNREISLLVSDAELAQRARDNPVIEPTADRGYRKLFLQTVTQADKGVDFDFMRASTMVGKTPATLTDCAAHRQMPKLDEGAKGVYVIAVTPFSDDGALDLPSTDRVVDFYLDKGANGLTVLGVMGEAPKLTAEEARSYVKRVLARVRDRVPVVVGVSAPGFAAMGELANSVMDMGAAGVMVAPAATVKTDDQAYAYFEMVAETLGPHVPFCLQDHPLATGVQLPVAVLLRIFKAVPTCVMLKHEDWPGPGLAKLFAIRAASAKGEGDKKVRRVSILVGNGGGLFLPEELSRGADGAMTGFSYPEMMVDVCKAHAAGDIERAHDLFDAYLPLARYEQQSALGLAVRKYMLAQRGAIASAVIRKPGPKLSSADIADIEMLIARQTNRLQQIG